MATVRKAIALSSDYDSTLALGGGEPTLHPQFWDIFHLALIKTDYLWLATNGSQTNTSLALAKLAKKGVCGVALSQDSYHDRIDDIVIDAFRPKLGEKRADEDWREIRNVDGLEIKSGRCGFGKTNCVCETIFVRPDGKIKQCGCLDAPIIGDVMDNNTDFSSFMIGCHKSPLIRGKVA